MCVCARARVLCVYVRARVLKSTNGVQVPAQPCTSKSFSQFSYLSSGVILVPIPSEGPPGFNTCREMAWLAGRQAGAGSENPF